MGGTAFSHWGYLLPSAVFTNKQSNHVLTTALGRTTYFRGSKFSRLIFFALMSVETNVDYKVLKEKFANLNRPENEFENLTSRLQY